MDSAHFVFSDDVAFNISLGNEDATIEKAIEISELANDLTRFEKGVQTKLMERGGSGIRRSTSTYCFSPSLGNRMPCSDSRWPLFGNPISAWNEKIMENLRKNLGDKIILLFSHRLTTFTYTDQILLLQNGIIAEMGTHNQLIALDGTYKNIYSAQVF